MPSSGNLRFLENLHSKFPIYCVIFMTLRRFAFHGLSLVISLVFSHSAKADNDVITDFAGANVNVGERLFLETRFSQFFFTNCNGDVNNTIPGDPTVATLKTTTSIATGPFAGQYMAASQSCSALAPSSQSRTNHSTSETTFSPAGCRSNPVASHILSPVA
jgi:hypothetical protein